MGASGISKYMRMHLCWYQSNMFRFSIGNIRGIVHKDWVDPAPPEAEGHIVTRGRRSDVRAGVVGGTSTPSQHLPRQEQGVGEREV